MSQPDPGGATATAGRQVDPDRQPGRLPAVRGRHRVFVSRSPSASPDARRHRRRLVVVGSLLLAPAIVLGYAVKAAEQEDREPWPLTPASSGLPRRDKRAAPGAGYHPVAMSPRLSAPARRSSCSTSASRCSPAGLPRHLDERRRRRRGRDQAGALPALRVQAGAVPRAARRGRAAADRGDRQGDRGRAGRPGADRAGVRRYFRWVDDDRDAFLLLFGSGARATRSSPRPSPRSRRHRRKRSAADRGRHRHRAPRTLAHGLVGLAEGVSRRLLSQDADFDPEVVARQVGDLAWAGLRAIGRTA